MSEDFVDRFKRALLISGDESPDGDLPEGAAEWVMKLKLALEAEGIELVDKKQPWRCPACLSVDSPKVNICQRCAR